MTINSSNYTNQKHTKAFQEMSFNMINDILSIADKPDEFNSYLTEQMREFTGARTVVLIKNNSSFGGSGLEVAAVNPNRRKHLFDNFKIDRLAEIIDGLSGATIIDANTKKTAAEILFAKLKMGLSIATPLKVGSNLIGALLLLDLPDTNEIDLVIEALDMLSVVIALVFRSSLQFEEQEKIIKQRTGELKISEKKFRNMVEMAADGILTVDKQGKITSVNPALYRMSGYSEEEIVGKHFSEVSVFRAEDIPRFEKTFRSLMRRKTIKPFEIQWTQKNGELMDSEVHLGLLKKEKKIIGLQAIVRDIRERKQAEEKIKHLNQVLHAIRNVNQLITKEKNIDRLIKGACENLIETRGYNCAWIVLLDKNKKVTNWAEAGLGKNFTPLLRQFQNNQLIECCNRALKQPGIVIIKDPQSECLDCPQVGKNPDSRSMTTRVEYQGKIFGIMSVSMPKDLIFDEEEQSLFIEIVDDMAFALDNINAERKRKLSQIRIGLLNRLNEDLLRHQSLEKKLKHITDGVVKIFDAFLARIWITEKGDLCDSGCFHATVTKGAHVCRYRDRCLHLAASSGFYTHINGALHRRVPFGCYKIGRIASGEESKFIINDVTNDPQVQDHQWAKKLGLVSFTGYQILSETGETIGVLALFSKHTINPDEDVLLETLANATAQILQTARAESAVRESEEKYRNLIENANEAIFIAQDGIIKFPNPETSHLTGYAKDELASTQFVNLIHPDDRKMVVERHLQRLKEEKLPHRYPFRIIDKNSIVKWVEINTVAINWEGRPATLNFVSDISERKKSEQEIEESNRRLKILNQITGLIHKSLEAEFVFKQITDVVINMMGFSTAAILMLDDKGEFYQIHALSSANININKLNKILGLPLKNLTIPVTNVLKKSQQIAKSGEIIIARHFSEIAHPPLEKATCKAIEKIGRSKRYMLIPLIHNRKLTGAIIISSKSEQVSQVELEMLQTFAHTANQAITNSTLHIKTKKAEQQIQKDLKEKEVLLTEIHHRVKNNLNVVVSLLQLQARRITDKMALNAFEESVNRIYSMALVHEQLYQSRDYATIDLSKYIKPMVKKLFYTYRTSENVNLNLQLQSVEVGINKAIPCGLILNELVTNSLKYAFPENKSGVIVISLKKLKEQICELVVQDDGIGIVEEINFEKIESLGLHLVKVLTAQIDGTVELTRNNGTIFKIKFPN